MATKRPAFQFYPADWRKDPALRMCSLAARGLWIDMLAIMHESDRYGFLEINGASIDSSGLARMIGESQEIIENSLAELEKFGVFSRRSGVIFSRRMVRDEALRNKRARSGKLGGNPKLLNLASERKVNGAVHQKDNPVDENLHKQNPTPSSSSSTSVSPIAPLFDDATGTLSNGKTRTRRKQPGRPAPNRIDLTDAHYAYAKLKGLDEDSAYTETEKFLAYHGAKGTLFSDWDMGWQNWIIKAAEIRQRRR